MMTRLNVHYISGRSGTVSSKPTTGTNLFRTQTSTLSGYYNPGHGGHRLTKTDHHH